METKYEKTYNSEIGGRKAGKVRGARCRVRTSDPYRVKVMLYR